MVPFVTKVTSVSIVYYKKYVISSTIIVALLLTI